MHPRPLPILLLTLALALPGGLGAAPRRVEQDPRERHLANLTQLTFGGENAEAYWSPDGTRVVFQSTRDGGSCDAIYTMSPDGSEVRRLSSGRGATTCAYFVGRDHVLYASTLLGGAGCPPRPDHSRGYVWALYPSYDIFLRRLDGLGLKRLTRVPGYDAEATLSPDGRRVVFTSMRTGDPELFTMDPDGGGLVQLTDRLGYDGGAFFTPDGRKIIWRRTSDMTPEQEADYRALIGENLVRPSSMDLWVMDPDGSHKRKVFGNGKANFAPYGMPDGSGILFASNMGDPKGRNFDLYRVGYDGQGLEQVTFHEDFDAFPMFSPDGSRLLFASNRFGAQRGETNLFVADWVP